mmetsp:Transcript_16243/g.38980  ORF Transcript_16243/g.38980 Transcript_16243/m.38980 type:complete len:81 (-) Transcript_16243:452-694(-)
MICRNTEPPLGQTTACGFCARRMVTLVRELPPPSAVPGRPSSMTEHALCAGWPPWVACLSMRVSPPSVGVLLLTPLVSPR